MSNETTSSTVAGWYVNQYVGTSMYAKDALPAHKFLDFKPIGPGSKVAQFAKVTKDTALSGTITEATGLSNVALDNTSVTATVAEVGIN